MEDLDKVYAKRIAEEYAPKTETKVVRLKKLDEKVKRPALIFTYSFGVISALILGAGMSMYLTDFGPNNQLGLILSIALGIIGLILCGINYPIYLRLCHNKWLIFDEK